MAKYYAVKSGRTPGVYNNWNDCKDQVNKYSGAVFKSFATQAEAEAFATQGRQSYSAPFRGSGRASLPRSGTSLNAAPAYSSVTSTPVVYAPASFEPSARAPKSRSKKPSTTIYTDGSSLGNGRKGAKAGWGCFWGPKDPRNASGPVRTGERTNNRAELMAIHKTLKTIETEHKAGKSPDGGYRILADSQYARDSLDKWTENWVKQGWSVRGKEVKNRDIIEPAYNDLVSLRKSGVEVAIGYIPAHSGHYGNEMADQMARAAASTGSTSNAKRRTD